MKLSKLLITITLITMIGIMAIMAYYTVSLEKTIDRQQKQLSDRGVIIIQLSEANVSLVNNLYFYRKWTKHYKDKSESYCQINKALKYIMQDLDELEQAGYVKVTENGIEIIGGNDGTK